MFHWPMILESEKIKKVGQNLKYDENVLMNHGIALGGIEHDTMLASYVVDSAATRHDMDVLAKKYLDTSTIHFEDIAGKGKKQLTFNQIEIDKATEYAAEDADIALQLNHVLSKMLEPEEKLVSIYREIEIPLSRVLSTVERTGVAIDADLLATQSEELKATIGELESQAHEVAGQGSAIDGGRRT